MGEQEIDDVVIFCAKKDIYNPEYKTEGSAGGDLRASKGYTVLPHGTIKVESGLKVKLPKGYALIVKPRSSLAVKKGLLVIEGTIDSDYRGEISIVVHNMTDKAVWIEENERIAQAVIIKTAEYHLGYSDNYDKFSEEYPTERGEGGFGSTGDK